jgi:hypothetical protein
MKKRHMSLRILFTSLWVLFGVIVGGIGMIFWEEWMETRRRNQRIEDEIHWQMRQNARNAMEPRGLHSLRHPPFIDDPDYDPEYQEHVQ